MGEGMGGSLEAVKTESLSLSLTAPDRENSSTIPDHALLSWVYIGSDSLSPSTVESEVIGGKEKRVEIDGHVWVNRGLAVRTSFSRGQWAERLGPRPGSNRKADSSGCFRPVCLRPTVFRDR